MGRSADRPISRWDAAVVAGLLVIAAAAVTATVLYMRGVWFYPEAGEAVERVLWPALWLPGMAFCAVLFRRTRRLSFALGFALQAAAIVLYSLRGNSALGGAVGSLGLGLPLVLGIGSDSRARKWLAGAALLGLLVAAYVLDPRFYLVLGLVWLWMPHARAIWPSVDRNLEEAERRDAQRKRDSRAYRWLCRAEAGLWVVLGLAFLAAMALWLWLKYLEAQAARPPAP
jgi:hypothetical protein